LIRFPRRSTRRTNLCGMRPSCGRPAAGHHGYPTMPASGGHGMNNRTLSTKTVKSTALPAGYARIHGGIVELLDAARHAAARSVNALMTASYWEIGRRIVEAEQQGKRRAGYGEQLIERLSADLTAQFGRGFSRPNLQQMRSFFLTWPIRQTVSSESSPVPMAPARPWRLDELAQVFTLPWSAYVRLLSVKDAHARQFYEAEAL